MEDVLILAESLSPEEARGFVRMPGYAIDAYKVSERTGNVGAGNFSEEAKELAIRTVARYYGVSISAVIKQFEVIIVPGPGFHGRILAKKK